MMEVALAGRRFACGASSFPPEGTRHTGVDLEGAIGAPTVAHVDDDGIYVAYGKAVYRYNLDGAQQTHLINAQNDVIAIHSDGDLLFLNHTSGSYTRLLSIDKDTNTVIDAIDDYLDTVYGSSIAPEANRIFGRTKGTSPSDITYVSYDDRGFFLANADSPYHGDYPSASTTWVFPSGAKVVDDSGTIYSTGSLTRLNSFGVSIDDIGFLAGEIPIVLSSNTLMAYSSAMLPTGSTTLDHAPSNVFVNEENVITFTADAASATGYQATLVPVDDLAPPTPGEPVDPRGLPYTPDDIELAADGTVLLFSKAHESIFRWNPNTGDYDATIPLIGAAEYMAYSSETNTVYLAYATGLIRKIDLSFDNVEETPLAILPSRPLGLSTAGSFVFAVDPSGAWVSHYTFAPDGSLVESVEWNYFSDEYVWNDANQKMYFFRDDTSPNDLLWEEINADGVSYPAESLGGIGAKKDSPLHGSGGFIHPIRVAPDGSVVVLGSGRIYDAQTLEPSVYALANSITDAAWLGGELITVRNIAGVTQYQHWAAPTYGLENVVQAAGTGVALLSISDNLLLGIAVGDEGIPLFRVMNAELEEAGVTARLDFGDAPTSGQSGLSSSYPTRLEDDGARHRVGHLFLGSTIDWEPDGQPDAQAGADEMGGGDLDDEDGVLVLASLISLPSEPTNFSLGLTASDDGRIDAWIDFNRDGDWLDAGEQIAAGRDVAGGLNIMPATVPAGALAGDTAMRVRLSSAGGLPPTGLAEDGEVEDYLVTIVDGGGGALLQAMAVYGHTSLAIDDGDIVIMHGQTELSRVAGDAVDRVEIEGTGEDDRFEIGDMSAWFSGPLPIGANGHDGRDTLALMDAEQQLDLTLLPDGSLADIEVIELVGSGGNRLKLDVATARAATDSNNVLTIVYDQDDVLDAGAGWRLDPPQRIADRWRHVFRQDEVTILAENGRPWTNPILPLDVDRSGEIEPVDALRIVNLLNGIGAGSLNDPKFAGLTPTSYYDTSGDLMVAPNDVLRVVNHLNRERALEGEQPLGGLLFTMEHATRKAPTPLVSSGSSGVSQSPPTGAELLAIPLAKRTPSYATAVDRLFAKAEKEPFGDSLAATLLDPLYRELL